MKRKWKCYRNASDCLERDENNQEEIMAYNAKTELTKYVFIFFINLLEWVALITTDLASIPNLILRYDQNIIHERYFASLSESDLSEQRERMGYFKSSLTFRNWYISCLILSLVLKASLCMYLSARQAKLSWMKSNKIPYLIAFFLISLIVVQTISGIYSLVHFLIRELCYTLLFISALVILAKQYRKLLMVIKWSIVDLQISGNIHSLKKQIQMKRRFTRTFKFIFTGYIILLLAIILELISLLGLVIFKPTPSSNGRNERFFLDTYSALYLVNSTTGLVAIMFYTIPYIGFGLSTMCVILWRLINGKTGYKTHFKNPVDTP